MPVRITRLGILDFPTAELGAGLSIAMLYHQSDLQVADQSTKVTLMPKHALRSYVSNIGSPVLTPFAREFNIWF